MTKRQLSAAVKRIKRMEKIYDTLILQTKASPNNIDRRLLKTLLKYYEGGQWLKDYEADENGLFPVDLKRGVLSQDGIYNLLSDISEHLEHGHLQ